MTVQYNLAKAAYEADDAIKEEIKHTIRMYYDDPSVFPGTCDCTLWGWDHIFEPWHQADSPAAKSYQVCVANHANADDECEFITKCWTDAMQEMKEELDAADWLDAQIKLFKEMG